MQQEYLRITWDSPTFVENSQAKSVKTEVVQEGHATTNKSLRRNQNWSQIKVRIINEYLVVS